MIHGYHFRCSVHPNHRAIGESVAAHLKRVGIDVSPKALRPAYCSLEIAGTKWFAYSSGGLRFDMTAEVSEMHPPVNRAMLGVTSWNHAAFNFSFREPSTLTPLSVYAENAGLIFRPSGLFIAGSRSDDDPPHIPSLQLARFDLCGALGELERLLADATRKPPGYDAQGIPWAGPEGRVTCQAWHACEIRSKFIAIAIALDAIQ